ncbi:MAG: LiaF transmembrane domain-containing protein [Mangrovibacterium sp.]
MNNPEVDKKYYSIGIGFIVLGAILIVNRLDIIPWHIDLSDIIFSWQMVLIVIGALLYRRGNKNSSLVLIGMGVFFLVPDVFNLPFTLRAVYWPSFLIFIGVFLLLQHKKRTRQPEANADTYAESNLFDKTDDFVILGSKDVNVDTKNFDGGQTTVIFGGVEYDMRHADINRVAAVECTCIFGGIGFKVPVGWKVKNEVKTLLGGVSDERMKLPDNGCSAESKVIVLKGVCIFGGIEIKY